MSWKGWEEFTPDGCHRVALRRKDGQVRRQKFNAEPTDVDGFRFASQREAGRYVTLAIEQRVGDIRGLEIQPQFALHVHRPDGVLVCIGRYVADFAYERNGQRVIEDAKGMRTPLYTWKRNHVTAEYGITVVEV